MDEDINNNNPCWAEDEIDLRELVKTLFRWWWLIVAITVVAMVTAFLLASMKPVQYEAKAVLVNYSKVSGATVSSIATSDALVSRLFDTLEPKPKGIDSYATLSKLLGVSVPTTTPAETAPQLTLTAKAFTANDASRIANAWAKLVVEDVSRTEVYDKQQNLKNVQNQLHQSQAELAKVDDALVAFQGKDQVALLDSRLNSLKQMQAAYLARQQHITLLIKDIAFLHKQFAYRQGGRASIGDDLAVLALLLKAVGSQSSAPSQIFSTNPLFSNQASGTKRLFSGDSIDERISFLENMQKDLQGSLKELDNNVTSLDSRILSLQKDLQAAQNLQDQLNRSKSIALTNYNRLASQLEKLKLEAQAPSGYVTIVGQAKAPLLPLSRRRSRDAMLAGIVGLMIGMGGAFVIEWWQGGSVADSSG